APREAGSRPCARRRPRAARARRRAKPRRSLRARPRGAPRRRGRSRPPRPLRRRAPRAPARPSGAPRRGFRVAGPGFRVLRLGTRDSELGTETLIRFAPPSLRTARWAVLVWGLFLLALTSWPSPPEVPAVSWIPDFDKFVHAILYRVEGYFLFFAIRWSEPPTSPLAAAILIGGILAVWGTLDELHQAWIPGRSMEGMDALTDALAGFSGGLAAALLSPRLRGPEAPSP